MRITCISADASGGSYFSEREVSAVTVRLFEAMPPFRLTRFAPPTEVKLFAIPAELREADWHTAPVRQLALALDGVVEYETTDGVRRRFGPGVPVLVEDTTGRGHTTRFSDGEQGFLFIPVSDGWPGGDPG